MFRRRKAFPPADGPWPVLLLVTARYTRVFPFKRNWLLSGLHFAVRQVHVDRPRDCLFFFAFYYCWFVGPVVNIYHRVQTFGGHFDFSHAAWKGCVAGLFRRRKAVPRARCPFAVLRLTIDLCVRPRQRDRLLSGLHFAVRQVHVDRPRDCFFFSPEILIRLLKQQDLQTCVSSACRLNLLFIFSVVILILVINFIINFIIFWFARQSGNLHHTNSLNWWRNV